MNLEQFFQLLRPTQQNAREQERKLRDAIESWEQRAFSLNAAIGLLRAALHLQQQHEDLLLQQRNTLSSTYDKHPSTALAAALIEQSRHHQHLQTYTLRALYRQLIEQKKQLLQQGQEHFLPVIQSLPNDRKERILRLFQQSQHDIQQVAVSRQEVAALRELEEQLQRPLSHHTAESTHPSNSTNPPTALHPSNATTAESPNPPTTATAPHIPSPNIIPPEIPTSTTTAESSEAARSMTSAALPTALASPQIEALSLTSPQIEALSLAALEQHIQRLLQRPSTPHTTIEHSLPIAERSEGATG